MVDDQATRRLMTRFYDGLLGGSLPAAKALAEAKRAALKAGGPEAEPSHWAAFVLWGLPD
jgi:CHAT domain-containing protein